MATRSAIEWTEVTWNPVTGCDRVAAGCDSCYALALAERLKAMGADKYLNDSDPGTSGPGFGVTIYPACLQQPLRWRTPKVVFVNSMSAAFMRVRTMGCVCAGQVPKHRAQQVSQHCPGWAMAIPSESSRKLADGTRPEYAQGGCPTHVLALPQCQASRLDSLARATFPARHALN